MNRLIQVLRNAKKLNINKLLNEILRDRVIQEQILDLIRIDQIFDQGIQGNNKPITSGKVTGNRTPGVYSKETEQGNQSINFTYKNNTAQKIAGEPYFLYDTGEWFDSFIIELEKKKFIIDALKFRGDTNMLAEYGPRLLDLTPDSKEKLRDLLLPLIQKKTREKILKR